MAYNASLANFMESQGVPYSGGITALAPVSNEQITSFLQANPTMTDAQIASAMNQYGVSPAQMAAATGLGASDVQSRYDTAQAANQNYQNLINQAYSSIGVTTPDAPGVDYFRTQLQSGAIRPEDFQRSFLTTAAGVTDPTYAANVAKAQELLGGLNKSAVEQAYQTVLGRAGDTEGINYFTGQLGLGALRPDQLTSTLAQAAIPVATSLEDRLALQRFLGKDIYAPETYLRGTSGMGYQDVVDYINANIQDPVKIAQAAARYGIDPSEILAAKQAVGGQDIPTLKEIEDYLAQGKAGFQPRFQDIVGSVFGTGDELTNLKTSLYDSIVDYIEGLPNVSSEKKQQLIAAQTPESVFSKIINPKDYESKSLEDILTALQSTSVNKQQEANRVAGIAQNLYGITGTQATTLANDLIKGTKTDPFATDIYNKLLKGGLTEDLQTQILQDAAVRAPGSKYFQDNPEALLIYKPLEEKDVSTGGYGYLNKAPILNANWAIENMGERNQIIPHLGSEPNKFGWITNSKYAETLMRGPAIYGVEFNNRNDIEKAIDFERRIKDGTIVNDPEGGYYDTVKNIGVEAPKSDNERKGYNPYSSDTLATLQDAAQKAGLDPANYRSAGDLYDALEDKTKDIYQVSGRAINYDPEIAKSLGVTQTTSGRGGVNHVSALYKKVGDKLIPLTAKAFEFHDPNTSRGFFGDLARDVASIPFAPEIISAATGGNPAVYAALKGAQTLALGGDAEAALKSAGLAYLTSNYIPKTVTPNVQMYLAQNPLISSLAQSSPELANFIVNAGTKAVVSSGLAAITGQDPEKAMLSALVSSGLGTLTKEGVKIAGIPQEYQSIVSNILSSVILNQDPTKSLTGAATNLLKNELKDFGREMIKSDQDKDRSKEIRT